VTAHYLRHHRGWNRMRWWQWASLPLTGPLLVLIVLLGAFCSFVLRPISDAFENWWYGE
jgi:hypothetical protein